jgi:hypothetical protein
MNEAASERKPRRPGGTTTTRKRSSGSPAPPQRILDAHVRAHIDPERRRAMIAEAAYFFAERRGFEPGYELNDWLAGEDQIDAALRLADMETAAFLREQARGS